MIGHDARVCVIGGGRSQVPFIEAAADRGLSTIVFDGDAEAPARRMAAEFVPLSTHDTEAVIGHLEADPRDLVGCFTYSSYEGALITTTAIVDRFGLRGLTSESLARTSSKFRMREHLAEAGLAVPEWKRTDHPAGLDAMQKDHRTVIVKPAAGSVGSEGVALVDAATADPDRILAAACRLSSDGHAVIEQFVEADEYSIDGYVLDGDVHVLAVSRKRVQGDHFVIGGYVTGAGAVPADMEAPLVEVSRAALPALALDNSYFSLDVLASGDGLYVIDAGPLLDAKIDRLLHHAGVDVYGIASGIALGDVEAPAPVDGAHGLRFIYAHNSGTLGAASSGPIGDGRVVLEMEKAVGDEVRPPASVADVLGWVCASGEDADVVWSTLESVDLGDRIEIEDPA